MNTVLGELAALFTAVLFTLSSSVLTLASRRIGSLMLNRLRLLMAIGWLLLAHALLKTPLPFQAGGAPWLWLGLSGVAGLVIGDAFLFQAFIWVGPRLTMLMMALSPALASLLAWLFLGENLDALQITGILLTLAGIGWVVLERNRQTNGQSAADRRKAMLGILCGLGAALGQAGGLVLAKPGAMELPAVSATLIRMLSAAAVLWLYTLLRGQARESLVKFSNDRRAAGLALAGSFFGPFLGVTFSMVAIQNTAVGIASTLMALTPIFLLPVGYFFFKERFGWHAIAGTLLAMLGVGLLFM